MASEDHPHIGASPHPTTSKACFIPRLGQGQQSLVRLLQERGVSVVVAPLYYLEHNQELSLIPTGRGMGKVLDPCTERRQLPRSERSSSFRSLPFGNDPDPYDPERARLSDGELVALGTGPVDRQRGGGGTLMLTAAHVAGGIQTRGRKLEIALADIGVRHFRAQRMDEPPDLAETPIRREIYASLAVRLQDLGGPSSRAALADAYLALGADGIWVKIVDYDQRAAPGDIRSASAFICALRDGGVPVVSSGAGQLHLALLAEGISASIGLAEGEYFSFPSAWRPQNREGARRGRTRLAYNETLHHSFKVGSRQAKEAFSETGCPCGQHPSDKPPSGRVVGHHAAILRCDQANSALEGDLRDRREWLLGSAAFASWRAVDAGLPNKFTSVALYQAVFEGLEAGREAAPGEQAEL